MTWRYYRSYFRPSLPREAKGGIKAQSRRSKFGESWWAQRWNAVLESFDIGARLGRGRSYARRGQVLSIDVSKGVVKAKVQGSRRTPYSVLIEVEVLSRAHWKKLADTLGKQAIFGAKLLAGEMPPDIEDAFRDAGLSLFPEKRGDLTTECSCPDWSNPCKHIAAVYYLLGEEFDRDPFLIFKLRGIDRKELVALIAGKTAAKGKTRRKKAVSESEAEHAQEPSPAPEMISADAQTFWGGAGVQDDGLGEVRIPIVSAVLPKRMGSFPFWRGEEKFADAMESIYSGASPAGMDVFLGERSSEKQD